MAFNVLPTPETSALPNERHAHARGPKAGRSGASRQSLLVVGAVVLAAALAGYLLLSGGSTTTKSAAGSTVPVHRTPALSSLSPQALYATVVARAGATRWTHVDVRALGGGTAMTVTQTAGPAAGEQKMTMDGGMHNEVIVLGPVTYFIADAGSLRMMGLPAAQAARYGNRWLKLTKGNPLYAQVAAGVTLPDVVRELAMTGTLSVRKAAPRAGHPQLLLQGRSAAPDAPKGATANLYVDGSTGLPVELDMGAGKNSMHAVFSGWGQPKSLAAPVR